ncbi:hypothetical protein KI387_026505, partial [Taxus chinensis]
MIEEEEVEVPVTTSKENVKEEKGTVAMETDDAQSNRVPEVSENVDVNMQETKNSSQQSSAGTTSENGASKMEDKTAQMETEAKCDECFNITQYELRKWTEVQKAPNNQDFLISSDLPAKYEVSEEDQIVAGESMTIGST